MIEFVNKKTINYFEQFVRQSIKKKKKTQMSYNRTFNAFNFISVSAVKPIGNDLLSNEVIRTICKSQKEEQQNERLKNHITIVKSIHNKFCLKFGESQIIFKNNENGLFQALLKELNLDEDLYKFNWLTLPLKLQQTLKVYDKVPDIIYSLVYRIEMNSRKQQFHSNQKILKYNFKPQTNEIDISKLLQLIGLNLCPQKTKWKSIALLHDLQQSMGKVINGKMIYEVQNAIQKQSKLMLTNHQKIAISFNKQKNNKNLSFQQKYQKYQKQSLKTQLKQINNEKLKSNNNSLKYLNRPTLNKLLNNCKSQKLQQMNIKQPQKISFQKYKQSKAKINNFSNNIQKNILIEKQTIKLKKQKIRYPFKINSLLVVSSTIQHLFYYVSQIDIKMFTRQFMMDRILYNKNNVVIYIQNQFDQLQIIYCAINILIALGAQVSIQYKNHLPIQQLNVVQVQICAFLNEISMADAMKYYLQLNH